MASGLCPFTPSVANFCSTLLFARYTFPIKIILELEPVFWQWQQINYMYINLSLMLLLFFIIHLVCKAWWMLLYGVPWLPGRNHWYLWFYDLFFRTKRSHSFIFPAASVQFYQCILIEIVFFFSINLLCLILCVCSYRLYMWVKNTGWPPDSGMKISQGGLPARNINDKNYVSYFVYYKLYYGQIKCSESESESESHWTLAFIEQAPSWGLQ